MTLVHFGRFYSGRLLLPDFPGMNNTPFKSGKNTPRATRSYRILPRPAPSAVNRAPFLDYSQIFMYTGCGGCGVHTFVPLAWYIAFYECAFRVSLLTLLIEGRECIFTRFKKKALGRNRIGTMASNNNNNSYPISSNSRTKLNAFRYKEETQVSNDEHTKNETKAVHDNKENQSSWLNGVVEAMPTSADKADPPPQAVPLNEETKPVKDCPQTPGNRIPLADLISNAEDAFDPAPGPEVTPIDHVIWQHVPASSNPDTSSQTPAGRRMKRRLSSSSAGSPTNGNSRKAQKEPLDLQSIQALFKTPQHDLAAELWNNYMDKNMVDGTEDLPPPRLANLLSSSPQTPASGRTSRDSSGLRRSISCAAEWPTSRAKRRRLSRQDPGSGRGIFSRTRSNVLDSGKGKSSRINFLLEKIEKSLHPVSQVEMGPPNSSPLRQHMDAERCRSSSPTMDRKDLGNAEASREALLGKPVGCPGTAKGAALEDSESEFGDDDLDQDFMDLADATEDPFLAPAADRDEFDSLGSSAWSNLAQEKLESSRSRLQSESKPKPPAVQTFTNNETRHDDSDDFDYGDFDDDFENALAECDAKPIDLSKQPNIKPEPARKVDAISFDSASRVSAPVPEAPANGAATLSDDEFDDEFDLDAIEQTMKQTGEDAAYVGHS